MTSEPKTRPQTHEVLPPIQLRPPIKLISIWASKMKWTIQKLTSAFRIHSIRNRLRFRPNAGPLTLILRRLRHGEIDLAPEFQRRARIWSPKQKSQLIKSLMLRIPLPVFYVAADVRDNWAVVDGLQRLTTIEDYCAGQFRLTGLEYLSRLKGAFFLDLPRPMQRRIEETELVVHVIQPGTPREPSRFAKCPDIPESSRR